MSPDPQQFVKFPVNVLEWRRHLSATKWTVLSVIHDKIARWDKESDAVSNSQIAAETTLSESSIRRAIAEMNTTDGPIDVVTLGARGIPVYRVRPCDRCQPDTPVNLTPLPPIGCQPDTPPTTIGVNRHPQQMFILLLRESLRTLSLQRAASRVQRFWLAPPRPANQPARKMGE
jgi:hypothetical protein